MTLEELALGSMPPLHQPIGVFDSGVGGLTVLKALRARLPGRDFVYLGDTARVPYGRKPREMVAGFAGGIARFLIDQGAQAVVIACNTASSAALPDLAQQLEVPVWGVIEPGVEAATRATRGGRVGVIGTRGTIASGAYQRRLEVRGFAVWAQACPMFVHVVEEGLAGAPEAEVLTRHYLEERPDLDALILGCTHYPLLKDVVARVVGSGVTLVDSAEATAEVVSSALADLPGRTGRVRHFVTGDVAAYEHTAQVIGGVDGEVLHLDVAELARFEARAGVSRG